MESVVTATIAGAVAFTVLVAMWLAYPLLRRGLL